MARQASAQTEFVRKLLAKNPDLTYSVAKPLLEKGGYPDVSESQFGMLKYNFFKSDKKEVVEPATKVNGDLVAALKFVTENGGLTKVKALLAERKAQLEVDLALVVAFEDAQKQFKAAS